MGTNKRPLDARSVAVHVLDQVLGPGNRQAQSALAALSDEHKLSASDRALAQLLTLAVLRHLTKIDDIWQPFVKKMPKELTIHNLLRIGVAQLTIIQIAPHAALHATVEAAAGLVPFAKSMVNAVLRNVQRSLGSVDLSAFNKADLPFWLEQAWRKQFGEETLGAIKWQLAREAPVDLTCVQDRQKWCERLGGALLGEQSIRLEKAGVVSELAGYQQGAWWVQDLAAASIVPVLGRLNGLNVLDLCAAPGGKTAQLAASGAKVTAVDVSPSRCETLRTNLARTNTKAAIITEDVLKLRMDAVFDLVLLDAPCSATGIARRHPDLLWTRKPGDIWEMAKTQKQLLTKAASFVRPGGRLCYIVCSLQKEEGEDVISAFCNEQTGFFKPEKPDCAMQPFHKLSPKGELTTLPCQMARAGGMDGFFACILQKNEAQRI